MATIKRFEDLIVWQKARELCQIVDTLISKPAFSKSYTLKRQIEDSSGSVMDNIAEGFGRASRLEFVNFLTISMGSASEVQSQSYRALDKKFISEQEFQIVYGKAEECGKLANNFISYLNNTSVNGFKFKGRKNPKDLNAKPTKNLKTKN